MSATFAAVIVNYNHGHHIHKALGAAINQTPAYDEIIVVDDASTDNSVDIINEHIKDVPHARIIHNGKNSGVVYGMQHGVREAKSDFVYLMSADDDYNYDMLSHVKPAVEKYPDVGMVSGNVRIKHVETGAERMLRLPFGNEVRRLTKDDLAKAMEQKVVTFYGGGNMIRREAILKTEGLHRELRWHADWFLYLLVAHDYPFAVVPEELMCMAESDGQYSHKCYDWKQQRPVTEHYLSLLHSQYEDKKSFFQKYAILPIHNIQTLWLILCNKNYRGYITPLLAWRCMTFMFFKRVGAILPKSLKQNIRKLLRV